VFHHTLGALKQLFSILLNYLMAHNIIVALELLQSHINLYLKNKSIRQLRQVHPMITKWFK